MRKILVISPHAGDETLGAGATLALHSKKGDEIYWCIVTEPYTPDWSEEFIIKRRKEIENVAKIYGIKKTISLGLPTVKLDIVGKKKVNDELSKVVANVKPTIVYAPYPGDLNRDHKMVFNGTMVATRPNKKRTIEKILCYETPSETEWGNQTRNNTFTPNYYVNVLETFTLKLKAMQLYESELKAPPPPRSLEMLRVLAAKRGSECGLPLAEAFRLVRAVER